MTPAKELVKEKILARFTGNVQVLLCAEPGIHKAVTDIVWYSKRLSVPGVSAGIVENVLYKFLTRHSVGGLHRVSETVRKNMGITTSSDITHDLIEMLYYIQTGDNTPPVDETEPVPTPVTEPEPVTDPTPAPTPEKPAKPVNRGLDQRLAIDRKFTFPNYKFPKYSTLRDIPGIEDNTTGYSSIEPETLVDTNQYTLTPSCRASVPVTALMGNNHTSVLQEDVIRLLPAVLYDSYFNEDRVCDIIEYHKIDTSDLCVKYTKEINENKYKFRLLRRYSSRVAMIEEPEQPEVPACIMTLTGGDTFVNTPMVKTARVYPPTTTPKLSGLSEARPLEETDTKTIYGYTANGDQIAPDYVYNQAKGKQQKNVPETGDKPKVPASFDDVQLPFSDIDFICTTRAASKPGTGTGSEYIAKWEQFSETLCKPEDYDEAVTEPAAAVTEALVVTEPASEADVMLTRISALEARVAELLHIIAQF